MKLRLAVFCVLFAGLGLAQSGPVGTAPSPMELFVSQAGVRTVWSSEVATLENGKTRAVVTAIAVTGGSQHMRGVKVELSSDSAQETIYLDEEATLRTRDALEEIANALARRPMPNGCMGAREFWPLYNWAWNGYHELNAEVCYSALTLTGRGRPQQ